MDALSIRWNKTEFLPNGRCVNTTVQMHHMNADQMHCEKAWWKLHENATSYSEQILEATPYETTAVRSLTSHLLNHPNMTNKTCRDTAVESHDEITLCSPMDLITWTMSVLADQTTTLCGHRVLFRRPAASDRWERERERERERGKSVLLARLDDDKSFTNNCNVT